MSSLNGGDISGGVLAAIEGQASPDGQDPRRGRNRICDGFCVVQPGDSGAEIGGADGVLMVACSRNCCCLTATLPS